MYLVIFQVIVIAVRATMNAKETPDVKKAQTTCH